MSRGSSAEPTGFGMLVFTSFACGVSLLEKSSMLKLLASICLIGISSSVRAQPAGEAAPAAPDGSPAAAEITAGQRHLMVRYGINASAAAERMQLQDDVTALAQRLGAEYPDDFGGVWIEHEPTYRIVVAFKGAEERTAIRDTIDPRMRRFVQIKNTRTSTREREAISDRIIAALSAAGIHYASYYEHKTDDMVIEVGSDAVVGKVRQALPQDLQNSVKIVRGNVPARIQATGTVGGEGLWGGWWISRQQADNTHSCSFAFPAKDNTGALGILTAAHCDNSGYIKYTSPSLHYVTLGAPKVEWNAPNTKYDYQFHLIAPLTTSPYVFFENGNYKIRARNIFSSTPDYINDSPKNIIAGYAASGYFKVTGTYGYYSQTVGDVLCKSGHSTGLTCGEVTHGYYTYNNAKGWIETGNSTQFIYATWGDSGGAVFTSPTSAGNIMASGIVTAATIYDPTLDPVTGQVNNSGDEKPCQSQMENNTAYKSNLSGTQPAISDCRMVHMPIDYVDDQQLITVLTAAP